MWKKRGKGKENSGKKVEECNGKLIWFSKNKISFIKMKYKIKEMREKKL